VKTFDELLELTPNELQEYKKEVVRGYIKSIPEKRRAALRVLQSELDELSVEYADDIPKHHEELALKLKSSIEELSEETKTLSLQQLGLQSLDKNIGEI